MALAAQAKEPLHDEAIGGRLRKGARGSGREIPDGAGVRNQLPTKGLGSSGRGRALLVVSPCVRWLR
jgi:hypothetical protein